MDKFEVFDLDLGGPNSMTLALQVKGHSHGHAHRNAHAAHEGRDSQRETGDFDKFDAAQHNASSEFDVVRFNPQERR